jgi:FkbM family methyltransferase
MVPQCHASFGPTTGTYHARVEPLSRTDGVGAPPADAAQVRTRPAYDAPKFITYAGNFEDVMLWRALGNVANGFYVDIGASSPLEGSVTRAFYERGWHGVNVEPNPRMYRLLMAARPRDVNLEVAVADRPGQQSMAFARTAALSTLDDDQAARLASQGMRLERGMVQVTTLRSLWRENVPPGQAVHFLKIDVEGYERQVVLGGDWQTDRPWIVLAEATRPQTDEPTYEDWEPVLTDAGYQLVYEDGLNRFYVAAEHARLAAAFRFPPNVFDNFAQASEGLARERARRAEAQLRALLSSRSWRLTAPLRGLSSVARRARRLGRRSGGGQPPPPSRR